MIKSSKSGTFTNKIQETINGYKTSKIHGIIMKFGQFDDFKHRRSHKKFWTDDVIDDVIMAWSVFCRMGNLPNRLEIIIYRSNIP